MNHLAGETSPYLLQHARNPVDWYPWTEGTLKKAREENRLMVISIGYAACHWCHVMEHESFEDEEVARIMNADFVSIKVDREERPDIDQVYMNASYAVTGRGGWPLNVIALPDGRPVFAGTYFRKRDWLYVLREYGSLYKSNLAEVISRIQSEGVTILLADQNLKFCRKTSDRGYILEKGIVQHQGLMEEIWQNEEIVKKYLVV